MGLLVDLARALDHGTEPFEYLGISEPTGHSRVGGPPIMWRGHVGTTESELHRVACAGGKGGSLSCTCRLSNLPVPVPSWPHLWLAFGYLLPTMSQQRQPVLHADPEWQADPGVMWLWVAATSTISPMLVAGALGYLRRDPGLF